MKRKKQAKIVAQPKELPRSVVIALLAVIVVFVAIVRIRLANMPLERDEGEFGYMGQLVLHGIPPYTAAYNMKLPGIYAAYALILLLFGQTAAGIHVGLLLVNVGTILLVYALGKRLLGPAVGVAASACYAVMSINARGLGLAAHATHFVALCAVGGLILLLKSIETGRWRTLLGSGLLLGLGFTMKQCGGLFALFGALYLAWSLLRERPVHWKAAAVRVAAFSAAAAVPFLGCCLVALLTGEFDKFWFWTVTFPKEYTSLPLSEGLVCLKANSARAIVPNMWIWALAGVGLTALAWNRGARAKWVFLLGFALFSLLSTSSTLYFREHYFFVSLPAVSLLAAVAVSSAWDELSRRHAPSWARLVPVAVMLVCLGLPVSQQSRILFDMTPDQACREIYGTNPFPESVRIADYIKAHTLAGDTVAVLGSEAELYFYTQRRAATSYIYTYSLVQPQRYARTMQEEMIRQIEMAKPKYIVFCGVPSSWTVHPRAERRLLDWFPPYADTYYDMVGLANIASMNWTDYYWGEDALKHMPFPDRFVTVFRRKLSGQRLPEPPDEDQP